jgi:hypothetical protein
MKILHFIHPKSVYIFLNFILLIMLSGCRKQQTSSYTTAVTDAIGQDVTKQDATVISDLTEQQEQPSMTDGQKQAFASVLEGLMQNLILPEVEREFLLDDMHEMSENLFSIYDIDRDGEQELIIIYHTGSLADEVQIIYAYDDSSGTVRKELAVWPGNIFYTNGIVKVDEAHGYGSDDVWPYRVWKYDKAEDSYCLAYVVDVWNTNIYMGNYEFPEKLDLDHDGTLYFVNDSDDRTYNEEKLMDYAEFEEWQNNLFMDLVKMEISYSNLTEENIHDKLQI